MEYFKHFPVIEYSNNVTVNILARNIIRDYVKNNILIYTPYILNDDERPDILADRHFGDFKYTWLIYYANDIFDPVRDWLMSSQELIHYVNYKYAPIPGDDRTGFEIAHQTIHEFRNADNLVIDFESWYFDVYDDMYVSFIEQPAPYDTYYNNPLIEGAIIKCTTESGDVKLIGLHYRSTPAIYQGYMIDINTFRITENFNPSDLLNQIVKLYTYLDSNDAYYKILEIIGDRVLLGTQLKAEFFIADGLQTVFVLDAGALDISTVRVWVDGVETTDFQFVSNSVELNFTPVANARIDVSMYGEMNNATAGTFNRLELSHMYFSEDDIILDDDYNPNQIMNVGANIGNKDIVTKWDYENALNEAKREIKLIDKGYAPQIMQEFKILFES